MWFTDLMLFSGCFGVGRVVRMIVFFIIKKSYYHLLQTGYDIQTDRAIHIQK